MKKVHLASNDTAPFVFLGGRRLAQGASNLFHPRESDSDLLRVLVRNAVLPMIGLHSLAMEKAPLRCGIASFSRRSESYSDGHHVFILECHFAHGEVYHQRGGVIPTEDGPARRA